MIWNLDPFHNNLILLRSSFLVTRNKQGESLLLPMTGSQRSFLCWSGHKHEDDLHKTCSHLHLFYFNRRTTKAWVDQHRRQWPWLVTASYENHLLQTYGGGWTHTCSSREKLKGHRYSPTYTIKRRGKKSENKLHPPTKLSRKIL